MCITTLRLLDTAQHICRVSTASICRVSAADICPSQHICPVSAALWQEPTASCIVSTLVESEKSQVWQCHAVQVSDSWSGSKTMKVVQDGLQKRIVAMPGESIQLGYSNFRTFWITRYIRTCSHICEDHRSHTLADLCGLEGSAG